MDEATNKPTNLERVAEQPRTKKTVRDFFKDKAESAKGRIEDLIKVARKLNPETIKQIKPLAEEHEQLTSKTEAILNTVEGGSSTTVSEAAQFPLSPEEAAELGMTHSEWMRHRWTGEWPKRLERTMNMVFREQTARQDSPPHEIVSEKDESIPIFESQESFAVWSRQTLSQLANMASEPINQKFIENIGKMLELSRIWCLAGKPYEQISQNSEHETSVAKISFELRRRLSEQIDFHQRADIADIYGWIENGAKDHKLEYSLDYPLMFLLEEQPLQVIGELINRDTQAGQLAFKNLVYKYEDDHNPEFIVEAALHVLEPLADRLRRKIVENKTGDAREEIEFLEGFFNELNTSPNVLTTAIARGFDRQLVADAILNALVQDEPNINARFPSHPLAVSIANLATSIYEPIDDSRPVLPPQLIPYVKKLLSAKGLAWNDTYKAKPVLRSFMNLSKKLDIKLPL